MHLCSLGGDSGGILDSELALAFTAETRGGTTALLAGARKVLFSILPQMHRKEGWLRAVSPLLSSGIQLELPDLSSQEIY
jgi:hypothetical protein